MAGFGSTIRTRGPGHWRPGWRGAAAASACPIGDQGLLIGRAFYRSLGGYRPIPLFEDVDLVRRIGRSRLVPLDIDAVTAADRYLRAGYRRRSMANLALLSLYFLGVSPALLARLYR